MPYYLLILCQLICSVSHGKNIPAAYFNWRITISNNSKYTFLSTKNGDIITNEVVNHNLKIKCLPVFKQEEIITVGTKSSAISESFYLKCKMNDTSILTETASCLHYKSKKTKDLKYVTSSIIFRDESKPINELQITYICDD